MENLLFILDFIKENIESHFFISLIFFFTFLLIYNALSIPGNVIFMASTGYFFGLYLGFAISLLGLVFGSLGFKLFANFFLKKFVPSIFLKYSNKIDKYISNSSFEYLIIFRMIPGPPLMLQNLILSILDIKNSKFILTSIIGFTPIVFITVFFGHQLSNFEKLKSASLNDIFSFEFLFFILLIIFILFARIFFKKK